MLNRAPDVGARRWLACGCAALATAVGGWAATARADPPADPGDTPAVSTVESTTTTTVEETTTESTTTTSTTTTTTTTTTASTSTAPTTTAAPATTTTAPLTTTPAIAPSSPATAVLSEKSPAPGCAVAAAVGVVYPSGRALMIGAVARAPAVREVTQANLAYPADGSIVTAAGIAVDAGCDAGEGIVELRALSLFGGALTARSVKLSIGGGRGAPTIAFRGLRVAGRPASVPRNGSLSLPRLGSVRAAVARPTRSGTARIAGLSVRLARSEAGLPGGTELVIGFVVRDPSKPTTTTTTPAATPPVAKAKPHPKHAAKKPKGPQPLKITPPLHGGPYTFPVVGTPSFGDTYGGPRSDVADGWHHGDDIFAPLGTPVVAVAAGTVNRVGWERLGGWRLWVRDRNGDEFYYAHLSGYAPAVLADKHVAAGQVIGFVGNTGDAFTTLPHLHFEVHPRSLLRLRYDGAVDPTRYLESWTRVRSVKVGFRPVHPPLPRASLPRLEALTNFRELLRVRPGPRVRRAAALRTFRELFAPTIPLAHQATPAASISSPKSTSDGWAAAVALFAMIALALYGLRRIRR